MDHSILESLATHEGPFSFGRLDHFVRKTLLPSILDQPIANNGQNNSR
ncbi:MAG: hypothetical protein U0836_04395 [Pirellulales bacterium]